MNIKTRLYAFTLIELLVVISIIGILAALLLANFAGIRDRADDAKNKSNLKQVQNALRLSYNDSQSYPSSGPGGSFCTSLSAVTANMTSANISSTCKYQQITSDTFRACISLNNSADREVESIANKCDGVGSITGLTNAYCVCSN